MGLRIGIYANDIHPHEGGGHTFQEQLLMALNQKLENDQAHTFIIFHNSDDEADYPGLPFLKFVKLKPSFFLRAKNKLNRFLKRKYHESWLSHVSSLYQIDFVWFYTPMYDETDLPYCFTVWDLQHRLQPYFPEVSSKQIWEGREQLYSKVLRKASFIITGTQRGKGEIINFYQVAGERINVLPLPTPSFEKTQALPISHLIDVQMTGKYLLYPAQFWAHKNHIRLIEAINILKQSNVIVHVYLVGSNKGIEQYVRNVIVKMGLADQIHFLGFVKRGELLSLYQNAFALVFPSLFGPDNLPPLEAFVTGCPAIVGEVPGATEQYGSASIYFDPLNSQDLADKILELKNNSGLREGLIQRGLMRAQQYTAKHYIDDVYTIFEDFERLRKTWAGMD